MIIHSSKPQNALSSNTSSLFLGNITSANSSTILFGREDEDRYLRDQEERMRLERIKQVRSQETTASKQSLQKYQEKQNQKRQKEEEEEKFREYQRKLQEIQELKKMKELEIERAGKAMRDAEEAEERCLREDLERKNKEIKDNKNAKHRGNLALNKERQLQEEKKKIEEDIKQIERKKLVQSQESQIAHELANKFRDEQESQKSQMLMLSDQHSSMISQINKYGNRVENSIISKSNLSQLDYTNTRFHNALIVRHDHEQVVSEELERQKQLKGEAFKQASEQTTKKSIQKAQKENVYRQQQEQAKQRGSQALAKEKSKQDKQLFEKEMKKVQKKEGWEKIQEGLRQQQENGAQGFHNGIGFDERKAVVNERKEKEKKDKLLNEFENEFITKEDDHKPHKHPLTKINVPKSQQIISNIETIQGSQQHTLEQTLNNQQIQEKLSVTFPQVQYQVEQFPPQDHHYSPYHQQSPHQAIKLSVREEHQQLASIDEEDQPYQMQQKLDAFQLQTSPSLHSSSHDQYKQPLPSNTGNFNTLQNPFFVPFPSQQPYIAPPQNALPQHNPFLEEIKRKEREDSDKINIHLVHPKQQQQPSSSLVDQFLEENNQFLENKDDGERDEEDSELPSDYGEEEESEEENSQYSSSSCSSASKSSSQRSQQESSTSSVDHENRIQRSDNAYQINKLSSNQTEVKPNAKVFDYKYRKEQVEASPLSDKYLNAQSNYDESKMSDSYAGTSSLADEFLASSGSKSHHTLTTNKNASSPSDKYSDSKMSSSLGQMSYLKSSSHLSNNYLKHSNQEEEKSYNPQQSNYLKYSSKGAPLRHSGAEMATPMSELSYSYSEMVNDFDGSNYGSSKMRMSNGSVLRQQQPYHNTQGSLVLQNNTIEEEDSNEDNKSSSHYSSDQKRFTSQKHSQVRSHQTPSFSLPANPNTHKSNGVRIDITEGNGGSLADAFRQKKQQLLTQNETQEVKAPKKEKTKEELAEIRRNMMKQRPSTSSAGSSSLQQKSEQSIITNAKSEANSHLMSRLAKGEKGEVSKKEMLKLTSKNYDLLPEVKKKKEEEKKKEEFKDRMKMVKELEKQRREIMKRK